MSHRYTLTTERFNEESGIFSKTTEVLELFRVKDITLSQPFSLRMWGLGNIVMDTSDKSTPVVIIYGVKDAGSVVNMLRKHVDIMRTQKGVREVD